MVVVVVVEVEAQATAAGAEPEAAMVDKRQEEVDKGRVMSIPVIKEAAAMFSRAVMLTPPRQEVEVILLSLLLLVKEGTVEVSTTSGTDWTCWTCLRCCCCCC